MSGELVIVVVHAIWDLLGMLFNATLFYLVVYHTPPQIKLYSMLIGNAAITDFCACLTSFIIQQRLVPIGAALIFISHGPCRTVGPQICFTTFCAMIACYTHTLYSLLFSFYFRYHVLRRQHPSANSLKLAMFIILLPSILIFAIACSSNQPASELVLVLKQRLPHYDIDIATISGYTSIFEWKVSATILLIATPIVPVLLGTLILKRRIVAMLSTHNLSENTKLLHNQLLDALTYQALLPSLFFFSLLCYVCGQTGLFRHPILESTTFFFIGSFPVLSPLISLFFIRPYRQHISRHIFHPFKRRSLAITEPNSRHTQPVF